MNKCRLCDAPPHLHNTQLPDKHDATCTRGPAVCHCGEHDENRGGVCCPAHGHREPPGHSEHCPERAREVAEYRASKKGQRR